MCLLSLDNNGSMTGQCELTKKIPVLLLALVELGFLLLHRVYRAEVQII
jgi:hypothetical protein